MGDAEFAINYETVVTEEDKFDSLVAFV